LPFTTTKLKKILALASGEEGVSWEAVASEDPLIGPGHTIGKAELLFRKIEDQEIQAQRIEGLKD
jgi:methionyl-tRNA synthetase